MPENVVADTDRWLFALEPEGFETLLGYPKGDGRRLVAIGRYGPKAVSITFHSEASAKAAEWKCSGFAAILVESDGQKERLEVHLDLPADLWEEAWDLAKRRCRAEIRFAIVGNSRTSQNDEGRPIISPSIRFSLDCNRA